MIEQIIFHPIHLKRLSTIRSKIYTTVSKLSVEYLPSKEPIPKASLEKYTFLPFKVGKVWTKDNFGCAWFRFKGEIPPCAQGKKTVALVKLCGEGEVYQDGEAKQGLTQILSTIDAGASLMGKQVYHLSNHAVSGEKVDFLVDAGHNGINGAFIYDPILLRADIATVDQDVYDYYYDYNCLLLTLCSIKDNELLDKSKFDLIDKSLSQSFKLFKKKKVKEARAILSPIFEKRSKGQVLYTAVGHGHLDLAWRWPIRESRRKAIRTFSNAISFAEVYPDYVFGASQAQMFEWVKEDDPVLYEKIKKAVKDGKIEVQGCMWTECDCNMSGGESIIRQFLYGEDFFAREFGVTSNVAWLPDIFGFTSTIPQIINGVGKKYFMTIKLNWNKFNAFPYQSFNWIAPDGSSVLAHMPPEGTYACSASPLAFVKADKRNKHKDAKHALLVYGVSDGGGGPGEGHLEMLKRAGFEGTPRAKAGKSEEVFDQLAKAQLPSYKGELYLEKHQGTLTSQALNKYYNRLCESKLHLLEWLETLTYPAADKEKIWKIVLLNQFHDILPGSGISRVHKESVLAYREAEKMLDKEIAERLNALSSGKRLTAVNPSPFENSGIVDVDGICYRYDIPAYSSGELKKYSPKVKADEKKISNEYIVVVADKSGKISVLDKNENEICDGYLRLYKDPKTHYDAWDINYKYLKYAPKTLKPTMIKAGLDVTSSYIDLNYTFGGSLATLRVYLQDSGLVNFELKVDWKENHKMLRFDCYPKNYSEQAEFDVQFGAYSRSCKTQTDIEKAQLEVCGHKYALVGDEKGYTAILTKSKYGYRVKDGLMSLNLLKAPKFPDKECDMHEHDIDFAILFTKDKKEIVKAAYNYNYPVLITQNQIDVQNSIRLPDNLILETVKPAEDGTGNILRIYERYGVPAKVDFDGIIAQTDMLERPKQADPAFKPYEIKTFLVKK